MVTKQYHFYLNPGKIFDDFLIKQLSKEKNLSGLVKSLLWVYYKEVDPYDGSGAKHIQLNEAIENAIKEM